MVRDVKTIANTKMTFLEVHTTKQQVLIQSEKQNDAKVIPLNSSLQKETLGGKCDH